MKPSYTLLVMVFTLGAAAQAQVAPAKTGPAGLPVSGTLNFNLRYSQTAQVSGSEDGQQWSIVSGDAGYTNTSKRLPFSMQYGGGYGGVWSGPSSDGNVFQHLALTQGFVERRWSLTAGDNVSYSFETPTTGFSGVPGSGEPIGVSGSTTLSDQSVLTQNTCSVDNTTTAAFGRILSPAMSLNVGGSAGQLRYVGGNGEDTDTLTGSAGLTRRLSARASLSGQYLFSRYNYGGAGFVSIAGTAPLQFIQTNSVQLGYTRQWNRQITTSLAAGPQWISSSNSVVVPSSTNAFVSASIGDKFRLGSASLSYSHGVTGGSGYMPGAESDNASGNFSRNFGRNLTIGLTGTYMRTYSLSSFYIHDIAGKTNAKYGEAQATRRLGRHFNVFANYTAIDQSSNLQISLLGYNAGNVINGLNQVIGFGIGYTPRPVHLRK
jgi:hypothetical protein